MSKMGWTELLPFLRRTGEYASGQLAEVFNDDKVIAGTRRGFFAVIAKYPQMKSEIDERIEKNVRTVIANAGKPESDAERILSQIKGESTFQRTPATQVDFQNLYETDAAIQDISWIVDGVEATSDPNKAIILAEQLFFYAFSAPEATRLDGEIARGMSALLEKRISVAKISELLEKNTHIPLVNLLNRFIPMFLQCLSMSTSPIEPLRELLKVFSVKMNLSSNEWKAFVRAVEEYINAIKLNEKGSEDICFLVLPHLMNMLHWPLANLETSTKLIKSLTKNYNDLTKQSNPRDPGYKGSIPGLVGIAWMLAQEGEDIKKLFSLRPSTYRTKGEEAEQKDLVKFFQHILEAASVAQDPIRVFLRVCSFFVLRFNEPCTSLLQDFELILLQLSKANLPDDFVKLQLLPFLKDVVSKMGGKSEPYIAHARRELACILLRATCTSKSPAVTLKAFLPIFEKHMPLEFKPLTKNIDRLLEILQQSDKQLLVPSVLVPLIDTIIPKPSAPMNIDPSLIESLLADAIFATHTNAWALIEEKLRYSYATLVDFKKALDSVVATALYGYKKGCLGYVKQNMRPGASLLSSETIFQMAFLCCLGDMLKFDESGWNEGLLPKIQDVLFGQDRGLTSEEAEIMKNIHQSLKSIPLDWFDPSIREGEILKTLKSW